MKAEGASAGGLPSAIDKLGYAASKRRSGHGFARALSVALAILACPRSLHAADASGDLTALSLEELMNVEVTTVSKKPEQRATAADAIFVLTGEDIRRSGATSIPEALRLVPGVQVARIDSNKWAIGVRGFATRLARSVLVLIDGRSVYNPLFAGTYWEIQDTMLEDIERIEVIRGPGGALWGANAFNGVINIITKDAAATQGALVSGGGGNEERGFGAARWGGKIGDKLFYRAYGKYFNRDGGHPSDYDDWMMARGGFRVDWRPQEGDAFTLQGDLYDGELGNRVVAAQFTPPFTQLLHEDTDASGGNVLGRWTRDLEPGSALSLQLYYDHAFRRDSNFREQRDSFDVDAQHHLQLPWRQDVVWGLEYRLTADDTGGIPGVALVPASRTDNVVSFFVQDELALFPERFHVTLGSRLEHNDYSGFEIQPSMRFLWTPLTAQTFWASISRAVRTPSRLEDDAQITGPPLNLDPNQPGQCAPEPCLFSRLVGDRDFDSEEVLAYQVGYRARLASRLFVDAVGFYQDFDNLLSVERGTPFSEASPPPAHSILPLRIANKLHGESYGATLSANAFLTERWRIYAAYTYLHIDLKRDPGSVDTFQPQVIEGSSPQNQVVAHSQVDLPWNIELDSTFRYVDNLPAQLVGGYATFDVRLGMHVTEHLELAVVGQNLADNHHREFAGGSGVERSAYGLVRWRW